jgi:hypothetical protein
VEGLTGRKGEMRRRGVLRFAFYGRVSTEDWHDPVTSRARQLQQAMTLVAGRGVLVAQFFDSGESRVLPWARRPQTAALVAALTEVAERVDWHAEDHEETMLALGLSSKREIARTRVRVRTAMAAQTWSRAGTWAGSHRTGTGSGMRGRTRTRRTPRGAGGRTGWNPPSRTSLVQWRHATVETTSGLSQGRTWPRQSQHARTSPLDETDGASRGRWTCSTSAIRLSAQMVPAGPSSKRSGG